MPIATPEKYAEMLDAAKAGAFAFPAINVSSSQTLNAALQGFADAGSDGIIQVSTGGAEYLSGPRVKNMVTGSVAFAAYAAEVAKNYPVNIALHTDHCPKDKLDGFVRPLLAISAERVARGEQPLFQSHMWDGSAVPLDENLKIAEELLAQCAAAKIILEVEIGVVGGEEDGVANEINEKLYTTPEDALATVEALGTGERGRYMTALTFGNVHGVYKPGNVKLRPEILKDGAGGGRRQARPRRRVAAVRPGLPRRLGLDGRGDRRRGRLRRREDERRHRHPVRLHPAGRRAHVHQLRRRAEGRRRGRQQEGLRPACLGQGRRGRHGRPRRRGLREPARGRARPSRPSPAVPPPAPPARAAAPAAYAASRNSSGEQQADGRGRSGRAAASPGPWPC